MSKQKKKAGIMTLVPGLLLVIAIALPAMLFHQYIYKPISALAVAIVLGLAVRNLLGMPESCKVGISFAVKRILRWAIILLGVRLSFLDVVKIGAGSLGIIITCIVLTIIIVRFISVKMGLPEKLGTLIGVGTAICGNSAIVATAPAIDAKDEEVSFAVATVTIFGLLAVFVYPLIGNVAHISQGTFGTWAGTAINDTSQVVTAGFIYGEEAGAVATVVKLTRTLFMAPVILVMSYIYTVRTLRKERGAMKKINYRKTFPWFVLGFVGMAALRTTGIIPTEVVSFLKTAANYLIVMAISGVGLGTSFISMKKVGLKPFYAGLAAATIMGAVSLTLVNLVGIK